MRIKELNRDEDILAMYSAQKRSFSRHPRGTKMANAALERAKALKAKKAGNQPEPTAKKKSTSTPKKSTRSAASDIPWQQIANDYNNGLNTKEIAEKHDLVRPKTKDGKVNKYPYYLVVGYLTKLSHGVDVNGKHIKITRGGKNSTRKAKK
jgi:hypothetical protein